METLNREVLKEMSVSDLLDIPLDAIDDAAGFAVPPKGGYHFTIVKCAIEQVGKEGNQVEGIVVEYEVKETLELADPSEAAVSAGTKFSTSYRAGQGVQFFKTDFKEVGAKLGAGTIADLVEKLNGCEVSAVLGHRKVPKQDNPEEFSIFPQVKNIQLA